jgi:glycosyltransferase involved in cell wall biosynthesis
MAATEAAGTPLVSVVVPCVNGLPAIAECLDALQGQEGDVPAEVVVVDRCGEETRSVLRRRFPSVRIVAAPPGTGIPALRALGIEQCRAPMVAMIEDHCNVAPGWLSAIDRARRAGHRVVGGAVENASTERLVDWAAFFCEYARFMPPLHEGPAAEVAGNNVAYARELLTEPGAAADSWEFFLHARLAEQGVVFHCDPALVVRHKKEFPFGYFMSQRYHYSRSFAGMRLAGASWGKRILYAAGTAFLPPLLFARIAGAMAARRRHWGTFLAAAPILSVFLLSWAWGEAVGALAGPGDSLEKVE